MNAAGLCFWLILFMPMLHSFVFISISRSFAAWSAFLFFLNFYQYLQLVVQLL